VSVMTDEANVQSASHLMCVQWVVIFCFSKSVSARSVLRLIICISVKKSCVQVALLNMISHVFLMCVSTQSVGNSPTVLFLLFLSV
jgi:hypothetical protein